MSSEESGEALHVEMNRQLSAVRGMRGSQRLATVMEQQHIRATPPSVITSQPLASVLAAALHSVHASTQPSLPSCPVSYDEIQGQATCQGRPHHCHHHQRTRPACLVTPFIVSPRLLPIPLVFAAQAHLFSRITAIIPNMDRITFTMRFDCTRHPVHPTPTVSSNPDAIPSTHPPTACSVTPV